APTSPPRSPRKKRSHLSTSSTALTMGTTPCVNFTSCHTCKDPCNSSPAHSASIRNSDLADSDPEEMRQDSGEKTSELAFITEPSRRRKRRSNSNHRWETGRPLGNSNEGVAGASVCG